jgi:hybrid cluster-associated redox disulfide protein
MAVRKKVTVRPVVTKDMLMGIEVLMKYGVRCIGCAVSPYESLEAGAAAHGLPLTKVLKEINQVIHTQKLKNKKRSK